MYSTKELIKALKVIQDTCTEYAAHRDCLHCPMNSGNGICKVQEEAPNEWMIEEPDIRVLK